MCSIILVLSVLLPSACRHNHLQNTGFMWDWRSLAFIERLKNDKVVYFGNFLWNQHCRPIFDSIIKAKLFNFNKLPLLVIPEVFYCRKGHAFYIYLYLAGALWWKLTETHHSCFADVGKWLLQSPHSSNKDLTAQVFADPQQHTVHQYAPICWNNWNSVGLIALTFPEAATKKKASLRNPSWSFQAFICENKRN